MGWGEGGGEGSEQERGGWTWERFNTHLNFSSASLHSVLTTSISVISPSKEHLPRSAVRAAAISEYWGGESEGAVGYGAVGYGAVG